MEYTEASTSITTYDQDTLARIAIEEATFNASAYSRKAAAPGTVVSFEQVEGAVRECNKFNKEAGYSAAVQREYEERHALEDYNKQITASEQARWLMQKAPKGFRPPVPVAAQPKLADILHNDRLRNTVDNNLEFAVSALRMTLGVPE